VATGWSHHRGERHPSNADDRPRTAGSSHCAPPGTRTPNLRSRAAQLPSHRLPLPHMSGVSTACPPPPRTGSVCPGISFVVPGSRNLSARSAIEGICRTPRSSRRPAPISWNAAAASGMDLQAAYGAAVSSAATAWTRYGTRLGWRSPHGAARCVRPAVTDRHPADDVAPATEQQVRRSHGRRRRVRRRVGGSCRWAARPAPRRRVGAERSAEREGPCHRGTRLPRVRRGSRGR
jgi:hypothetical protein